MGSCLTKEEQTSQMSRLSICGGNPLKGKISISGAKNASLPIMAAALLTEEAVKLSNVPNLTDVLTMINLLESHGVEIDKSRLATRSILEMRTTEITSTESPREITRQMRASVLVLGPLLARMGRAKVYLPGGCKIGSRPIDIHLSALEELGAQVIFDEASGTIEATISSGNRLRGAEIHFLRPSVGATENILMAACLADGVTTIHNAAREPEIADLAKLLNNMGARISGVGSSTLTIQGVHRLGAVEHEVLPDRIEAGTYAVAACATGGRLELENVVPSILEPILELLQAAGACVEKDERRKRVIVSAGESMKPVDVTTAPHPGFPTDMQSQWMALMCLAVGESKIKETIFENRFKHVGELERMGAHICRLPQENAVTVTGVRQLHGAEVWATDLRAAASLLIAALSATGSSVIHDIYHLERGYERVVEKLANCGASIRKI